MKQLTGFVDIHNHMMFGVDDGASSEEMTREMLEIAYKDGIRGICLTPHFYNPMIKKRGEITFSTEKFERIKAFASLHYPDLRLWCGNELFFHNDCLEKLDSGQCYTLDNSRYVLVEFFPDKEKQNIYSGLHRLLKSGYVPVLAHIERYRCFYRKFDCIKLLSDDGVRIQINASSVLGDFGVSCKHFTQKLLRCGLVDFVATDAHNKDERAPLLSECFEYVEKKYGLKYAEAIFRDNALKILRRSSHNNGKE